MKRNAPQDAPASADPPCGRARVAFFGGSFDPPHLGHLAIARAARNALRLDRVLFAPVGAQPLKPAGSTAAFRDRLTMTELAIAGEPGFEISLADAPAPAGQPNYTLETLRILRAGLPVHGCLFCLMGADSFRSLRKWRGAADIPFAAALIVASRPGQQLDDLARFLPQGLTLAPASPKKHLPYPPLDNASSLDLRPYLIRNPAGEQAPFFLLPGLDVEISASDIRAHIRSSSPDPATSLPAPVAEYIRSHALYQACPPET
jgi:nicotinate-nucleotide adenylyltransferase